MIRGLIAVLLAAAPCAAATAQEQAPGDWGLAAMPNGCMVQAVSPNGTMLSVWGFAGQSRLGFLLQNREWSELRDGERYDLKVEFVGQRSWPVEATARSHIDGDGPGFFFSVKPDGTAAGGFLDGFATAKGMSIRQDGRTVDTLPLAGSRGAMAALAKCLAEKWNAAAASSDQGDEPSVEPAAPTT